MSVILSSVRFLNTLIAVQTLLIWKSPKRLGYGNFIIPFLSFGQITKFESKLPIVMIDTENQTILNEERIICNMGIIYNEGDINNTENAFNEYNGNISIEIRGTSSQFFEKKSYSIETQKINGDNNNVPLLGLPRENDWILYGPYYDKTLIRNTLTYKLFQNMGHYSPRYRYCELFINDDYKGVYVFIEKIIRTIKIYW